MKSLSQRRRFHFSRMLKSVRLKHPRLTLFDWSKRTISSPVFRSALLVAIVLAIFATSVYAQGSTAESVLDKAWDYFYNKVRYKLALFAMIPAGVSIISRDPSTRLRSILIAAAILVVALIPYFITLFKEWAG